MRISGLLRPCSRSSLYNTRIPSVLSTSVPPASSSFFLTRPNCARPLLRHGVIPAPLRLARTFATARPSFAQSLSETLGMQSFAADTTLEEDAKRWKFVSAAGSVPAHHVYDAPIQKSQSDDRDYRLIRLENGIEALLVHDEATDKSAASMDVAVGHLSDPDDMPGLAHFCEHLSFMGTEQFPKENEYSEYLAKNNGGSNAYTAADSTNYYFYVASDALPGALERFAGFFHSPLFNSSGTLRELNAVDSENKKNLQNDMWRIFQLNKHLTRPGHPWKKFGTGNKKTLTEAARRARNGNGLEKHSLSDLIANGVSPSPIPSRVASPAPSVNSTSSENESDGGSVGRETRRRLIEWWSREYCASRMCLTVVGKESLDELTEAVTKHFSSVLNRGQDPLPIIPQHPFGENERGTIVYAKSIVDLHAFEISFPLAYQAHNWRTKPASFLAHFIGHEGPGSLHAYLKSKGWITELSAGQQQLARGFEMFKITVRMTKEGFAHYKEAIKACYKYVSLLRDSQLKVDDFNEIRDLRALSFQFKDKGPAHQYALGVASHMKQPLPRSLLLSGQRLLWKWDPELIRQTLNSLVVEDSRVFVISKDPLMDQVVDSWSSEPWYDTQYAVKRLDEDIVASARRPNDLPDLFLPGPNLFIPSNVDVDKKEVEQPLKLPSLIKRTELMECWHKKDDQFWVPKAQVKIIAKTPVIAQNARTTAMTRLLVELVKDALNEYAYDADLAGLRYDFNGSLTHLSILVDGYNDKLPVLVQAVLDKIKNLEIREDRFQVYKAEIKRDWENSFLDQSFHLADYYAKIVLSDVSYTYAQKLEELATITSDELRQFKDELLGTGFKYHMLVNGNMGKLDALRIASMIEHILSSKALPADKIPHDRSRLLPESSNNIWEMPVPNPEQLNGALTYYCHVGNGADDYIRATFKLLVQILSEPAFNILRTQEQLGYVVFCSSWPGTESIGMRIVVQSSMVPRYCESRVEAFLVHMRGIIESMSQEEFEEHKRGLIRRQLEKLKKLSDESGRFWNHIDSGYLDFTRTERDAHKLSEISKDDVLDLFKKHIDPASPTRAKLSVHMIPQKPPVLKLSISAAQAFRNDLQKEGFNVDDEEFNGHCSEDPPISSVKEHFEGRLREQLGEKADALLQRLDEYVKAHPAIGQGEIDLDPKAVILKDGLVFREGLQLTGTAKPFGAYETFMAKY